MDSPIFLLIVQGLFELVISVANLVTLTNFATSYMGDHVASGADPSSLPESSEGNVLVMFEDEFALTPRE